MNGDGHLELLDWRRRVHALYAEVRALREEDPVGAHTHWRDERDRLFAAHPQSALDEEAREAFRGLYVADYDPSLVFTARVDTRVEHSEQALELSGGNTMTFRRFGVVELPMGWLDVFWLDSYAGGVFLPFMDATTGGETGAEGRYLLDTAKGTDLGSTLAGDLVLDFNYAYHPSCHYGVAWSCPLAPTGNRLDAPVIAGELAAPA